MQVGFDPVSRAILRANDQISHTKLVGSIMELQDPSLSIDYRRAYQCRIRIRLNTKHQLIWCILLINKCGTQINLIACCILLIINASQSTGSRCGIHLLYLQLEVRRSLRRAITGNYLNDQGTYISIDRCPAKLTQLRIELQPGR